MSVSKAVEQTASWIKKRWSEPPRVGVVLGSGLGGLATHLDVDLSIAYDQLRHFPAVTALGHEGRLVLGRLAGTKVVALQGRFHYYEGYSFDQVTLPVRVMAALGAEILIVSNASGGLNPRYQSGDIMAMVDHIDLMGNRNARSMPRTCRHGHYDNDLVDVAVETATRQGFACHRGVYAALCGPNYETRAEYRFLRRIGADVVGMSTVPEVIAASACSMRVLALSTVTNVADPDSLGKTTAQEVVDIASSAEPRLRAIVETVIATCAD